MNQKLLKGCAIAAAVFVAVALVSGVVGTVAGLWHGLRAVGGEAIDPSQKARILAEGISEAMNCAAFAFIVLLPVAAAVAAGWWRWRRRSKKVPAGSSGAGPDQSGGEIGP